MEFGVGEGLKIAYYCRKKNIRNDYQLEERSYKYHYRQHHRRHDPPTLPTPSLSLPPLHHYHLLTIVIVIATPLLSVTTTYHSHHRHRFHCHRYYHHGCCNCHLPYLRKQLSHITSFEILIILSKIWGLKCSNPLDVTSLEKIGQIGIFLVHTFYCVCLKKQKSHASRKATSPEKQLN